jgi:hypothetical protein
MDERYSDPSHKSLSDRERVAMLSHGGRAETGVCRATALLVDVDETGAVRAQDRLAEWIG